MEGQHKESFPDQVIGYTGKKYTHERHGMISLGLCSGFFGSYLIEQIHWLLGKWQTAGRILVVQVATLGVHEHVRSVRQRFSTELRAMSVQAVVTWCLQSYSSKQMIP